MESLRGKRIRIVGIDDEGLAHLTLREVLRDFYPNVEYVATGDLKQAALEIKKGAHGVITDYDLSGGMFGNQEPFRPYRPYLNVAHFVSMLKRRDPLIPIALHTGARIDDRRILPILRQGVHYIEKGTDITEAVGRFVKQIFKTLEAS